MSEMTRQQLCAALAISESTVRRLEAVGLPYTPVGLRSKRYDLLEVKGWLRNNGGLLAPSMRVAKQRSMLRQAQEFTAAARKVKVRVRPSGGEDEQTILVSAREAATMLGIGVSTLWREAKANRLPPPVKIGGATRWRVSDLLRAVEGQ